MRTVRQLLTASIAIVLVLFVLPGGTADAQQAGGWQSAVTEANRLHAAGKIADAIAVLRKARPGLPPIHQLQLVQYFTVHVMESPKMPRADAQKFLDEARVITDDLITRKQEVRMALMAKSLVLKTQAERVEQNPQRQQALIAESERAYENARSVNADGTPVVKSVDDLWYDAQRSASTTRDGKDREDVTVYERFLAAHKDYVPAMLEIARYHTGAADAITDSAAKSVATRTRHLETAAAHYRRASEVATQPVDAVMALVGLIIVLDTPNLSRTTEAAAVARAAVKKYPDNAGVVFGLVRTLLPTPEAALDPTTLRAAREAVPPTPEAQHALAVHLFDLERRQSKAGPSRESSRKLLAEAVTALDAALKSRPDNFEVLMYKAVVLKAQADRVEQDPARIKALNAESDRLRALATKLMKR